MSGVDVNVDPGNTRITFSLINGSESSNGKTFTFSGFGELSVNLKASPPSQIIDSMTGFPGTFTNMFHPYTIPANTTTEYMITLEGQSLKFEEVDGVVILDISNAYFAMINNFTISNGGNTEVVDLLKSSLEDPIVYPVVHTIDISEFENNVHIDTISQEDPSVFDQNKHIRMDFKIHNAIGSGEYSSSSHLPENYGQITFIFNFDGEWTTFSLLQIMLGDDFYEFEIDAILSVETFDVSFSIHDDISFHGVFAQNGDRGGSVLEWIEPNINPLLIPTVVDLIRSITSIDIRYNTAIMDIEYGDPEILYPFIFKPNKSEIIFSPPDVSSIEESSFDQDLQIIFSFFKSSFDCRINFILESEQSANDSTLLLSLEN